jgi:hypothetical protein
MVTEAKMEASWSRVIILRFDGYLVHLNVISCCLPNYAVVREYVAVTETRICPTRPQNWSLSTHYHDRDMLRLLVSTTSYSSSLSSLKVSSTSLLSRLPLSSAPLRTSSDNASLLFASISSNSSPSSSSKSLDPSSALTVCRVDVQSVLKLAGRSRDKRLTRVVCILCRAVVVLVEMVSNGK